MISTSVKLPEPVLNAFNKFSQSNSEILRQKAYEACLDALIGRCAITGELLFMNDNYHVHHPEPSDTTSYNTIPDNGVLVHASNLGDAIATTKTSDDTANISFTYLATIGEPLYQAERDYLHGISGDDFPGFEQRIKHGCSEHAAHLLKTGDTKNEVTLVRDVLHWASITDNTDVSLQTIWDEASTETKTQIANNIATDEIGYSYIDTDNIDNITEYSNAN